MTFEPPNLRPPVITLREFLLGDRDPEEGLGDMLDRGEIRALGSDIGAKTRTELRVVRRGLGKALGDLLQFDLVEVLVSAWSKYHQLLSAARASVSSVEPQRVVLLEHTVTSRYQPRVDVLVDGVKKASVRFELGLEFHIEGVVATVQSGRLTALEVAGCDLGAFVACQGQRLLQRTGELLRERTLALPGGGLLLVAPASRGMEAEAPPVQPLDS